VRGTSIGCGPCVQSELIAGLPADNEGIEGSQLNDYGIRLPCRGTGVKDSVATVSWLTPAPVCPPDTHPPGPGSSRSGQGKKRISFWMAGMSGVQVCPGGKHRRVKAIAKTAQRERQTQAQGPSPKAVVSSAVPGHTAFQGARHARHARKGNSKTHLARVLVRLSSRPGHRRRQLSHL
jgi:hypothetical protein